MNTSNEICLLERGQPQHLSDDFGGMSSSSSKNQLFVTYWGLPSCELNAMIFMRDIDATRLCVVFNYSERKVKPCLSDCRRYQPLKGASDGGIGCKTSQQGSG
jgi:hypothetical protein